MQGLRFSAIIFILCLITSKVVGQEAEVIEQNDAIRPSFLSYKKEDSVSSITIKSTYFDLRGLGGVSINNQFRNIFTKDNYSMAGFAANYYVSKVQFSGKLIYHQPFSKKDTSFFRSKLQVGFYMRSFASKSDGPSSNIRLRLGWATDNYSRNRINDTDSARRIIHDFYLIYDGAMFSWFPFLTKSAEPDIVGGYLISYKPQLKTLFYGYSSRYTVFRSNKFLKTASLGAGYFRQTVKGKDRGSFVKLEGLTTFANPTSPIILYGSYSVNYRDKKRKNWEIGLLINVGLMHSVTVSTKELIRFN